MRHNSTLIIFIGIVKSCNKISPIFPSRFRELRYIKELPRHAIWLARIIDDLRMIIHDIHQHMSELSDRDIFTCSNIEKICTSIVVHEIHHHFCKILYVEEFATSRSSSPYTECGISSKLGRMHPRYHSRDNMSSLNIEVISRTIDIGRHTRDKILTKLPRNVFTESHPSNLCYCISLIRRFEFACHEILFLHRLWTFARIDTTTSKE